jgi:hypothetical protein
MRRLVGGLGRVAAAVALGLVLLGVPVLVLSTPPVTAALVSRYYDPAEAGLPLPRALTTAEQVRVYTTDAASPPLPATVDGRSGFDESSAGHLRDVRGVLLAARSLTFACAAVLALALAFALPAGKRRGIAWVLRAGSLGTVGLAVVAGVAGAVDFERFFAAFHGLFFAAGSWEFPAGTLLIELFPEPLWAALGALWAFGVLLGAGIALGAAYRVSGRRRSLVGQDV